MGFAISFIEFIHHTAKFLSASEQPLSIASLQPMGNSLAFWRLNPPVTAFVNVEIQKLAYNFNVYTQILPNIIIPSFLSTKPLYCIRSLQVYLSNYRSTLLFMFDFWNDLATNDPMRLRTVNMAVCKCVSSHWIHWWWIYRSRWQIGSILVSLPCNHCWILLQLHNC